MKGILKISGYLGLLSIVIMGTYGCSAKKQVMVKEETENISNTVEIFMAKEAQMEHLEKAFAPYELKSKGMSSRSQNIAIFSFNNKKIDGNSLLTKLMDSELVLAAKLMEAESGNVQSSKSGNKRTVIINQ